MNHSLSYVAGDAVPGSLSITVPLSRYTSIFMAQKRHSRRIGVSHPSFWGMTGAALGSEASIAGALRHSFRRRHGLPCGMRRPVIPSGGICALTCPIDTSSLQNRITAALALVGKYPRLGVQALKCIGKFMSGFCECVRDPRGDWLVRCERQLRVGFWHGRFSAILPATYRCAISERLFHPFPQIFASSR